MFFSCRHQSSNYSHAYMFNIYFPEYFSSLYHDFPSNNTPTTSLRKHRNTTNTIDRPATYTPSNNPKHPHFHYYNKKKHVGSSTNTHNNTQKVSISIPNPVRSWYRRYHPISTLCADYDNFIFRSIQYWSIPNLSTELPTIRIELTNSTFD